MRPLKFSHGECATEGGYASQWLLAYGEDIDIIGRTMRVLTAAFSAILRESAKMGLAVNEGKTK